MKKLLALSVVALASACMYEGPRDMDRADARSSRWSEGPQSVAEALNGRVQSGPPQNCVSQRTVRGNRSAGEGAIIFRTTGSDLIYVNHPPGGCPEITSSRAISVRTPTTQLCRGDIISVFDPVNGFNYGSCSLGDFIPFRRAR